MATASTSGNTLTSEHSLPPALSDNSLIEPMARIPSAPATTPVPVPIATSTPMSASRSDSSSSHVNQGTITPRPLVPPSLPSSTTMISTTSAASSSRTETGLSSADAHFSSMASGEGLLKPVQIISPIRRQVSSGSVSRRSEKGQEGYNDDQEEMDGMAADAESVRRRLAAFNTRSLGNMREKQMTRRDRALSDSRPNEMGAPYHSHSTTQPLEPTKPAKKAGGFANFFRRLTGKAPKVREKDKNVIPLRGQDQAGTQGTAKSYSRPPIQPSRSELVTTPRPIPIRQSTAPTPGSQPQSRSVSRQSTLPSKPRIPPQESRTPHQPTQRPPQVVTQPSYISAVSMATADPSTPGYDHAYESSDPRRIPLPPSPLLSPAALEAERWKMENKASVRQRDVSPSMLALPLSPNLNSNSNGATLSPTLVPRASLRSPIIDGPRSRSASPRRLSAHAEMDQDQETDQSLQGQQGVDIIRPLAPWRINTARARSLSPGSTGATLSAVETVLCTPSTVSSSPPPGMGDVSELAESEDERGYMRKGKTNGVDVDDDLVEEIEIDHLDMPMYAGSSPPRKAPIAPIGAQHVELSRKGTKWRRSVMNMSDTLNGTISRKQSTRQGQGQGQTGNNREAYHHQQQQQRQKMAAAHRISCQPTLHSNASIAAQMRVMKNDEEKEAAETFFMS